jgi:2-furoate---CoA ligase
MNLRECFEAATRRSPLAVALVDGEIRWTYAQLATEVATCSSRLRSLKLRSGDRVMVLLRNRCEHVVIFWACQSLGLVYIPLSYRLSPNDIAYSIEDTEPELLVFDEMSAATIHALAQRSILPKAVFSIGMPSSIPYSDLADLPATPAQNAQNASVHDDAIAVMLYSSGSTGVPKGIPRSHTNEISSTLAHIIQNGYRFGESTLALSSFCHTMGLRMLLAMTLLSGKLVIAPAGEPETQLALIAQERVSCLYAFPSIYHDLSEHITGYDVRSVRKIAYAGDAMASQLVENCIQRFSPEICINHFGSTEIYTYTICSCMDQKPGCAGKAGIHSELRLVVPSNIPTTLPHEVVQHGEVGELIVRLSSPEAFRGYWNRPDLTTKTIRQGWYFTGDLARFDDDGDLWVIGRVDDMVISGGEKVYPSEVETVLKVHPKVSEVIVLGIPDARAGKLLTAFVVPHDPSLTTQELADFCAASPMLADFKRPAKYVLLDHFPRRDSKVLRRDLARLT